MDGPIDWWWKMNLLDVCVQAGFCQIRSHMYIMQLQYYTKICMNVCTCTLTDIKESDKTTEISSYLEIYTDDQTVAYDIEAGLEDEPTMDKDISKSIHKPPLIDDSKETNKTLTSKSSESTSTEHPKAPTPLPRKKKTDNCKS